MDNKRTIRGMVQEIVIQETKYLKHYVGKVVDTNDEQKKGRVKVTVPMLGWISPAHAPWCYPRDKHSMIVPKTDEWVEVYFLAGHRDNPVYLGIASEMKEQIVASYTGTEKSVLFEEDDASVIFDKTLKQFIIDNVVQVILDSSAGITLGSGDASAWCPNVLSVCPIIGIHGGVTAGIVKLRGA